MSDIVHVIKTTAAPTLAPSREGQHWVDTVAKQTWISVGTATVNDWILQGDSNKVKASYDDTTADYLSSKLSAGTGIALTTINPGANEVISISSPGSTTDENVKASNTDTTPGHVNQKITAGYGIDLTLQNPAGNENLLIDVKTGTPSSQTPDQSNSAGSATTLAKSDHIHDIPTGTPSTVGSANAQGTAAAFARQDHIHSHGSHSTGTDHAVVTTTVNGFMSAADKVILDASYNTPLTSAAPQNVDKSSAVVGVATSAARADHKHDTTTAAPSTNLSPATSNAEGSSSSLARADHLHTIATALVADLSSIEPNDSALAGSLDNFARGDHQHAISVGTPSNIGSTNAAGSSSSFVRADHVHKGVYSVNGQFGTASLAITDLTDTAVSSPVAGEYLTYNGTAWINQPNTNPISAGAGVNLFYTNTASGIGAYDIIQKIPDAASEVDESTVVNNNTVFMEGYITDYTMDTVTIDAGIWNFNTYAYSSSTSGINSLIFDIYKRTSGGAETLLFSVNTDSFGIVATTPTLYITTTAQPAFTVNQTDKLVVKVSASTTNTFNTTVHFVHSGTQHYSYISTPLITKHNDLAGLQGGTTTERYHLTAADVTKLAGIATGATVYTDEMAQDTIGAALTDTTSIDFTYNDAGNQITAVVLPGGVDHNALLNWVANKHIDHSSVVLTASTGLSGGGDITTNRSFSITATGVTAAAYGSATQVATFTVNATGQLTLASNTTIAIPSTQITDFTEAAQDAVGGILTDTSSIDFTYNDAGNQITAVVLPGGVNHNALLNGGGNTHIDHSAVSIIAGTGLSGGGDLTASRTLSLPSVITAGTYGDTTHYPIITVDAQGRTTSITTHLADSNWVNDGLLLTWSDETGMDLNIRQAGSTGSAYIRQVSSNGTLAAPTVSTTGQRLGGNGYYGWGVNGISGQNGLPSIAFNGYATENHSATANGGEGRIEVIPNGSVTPVTTAVFTNRGDLDLTGAVQIGDTTDTTNGNIRYNAATAEFQGRQAGVWVPFHQVPTYLSSTSPTATTSATFSTVATMTLTPAAGTYKLDFTASYAVSVATTTGDFSVFIGAVEQTTCRRTVSSVSATTLSGCVAISTIVTVNGSQVLDIRFRENASGTLTVNAREFILTPISR